jgi:hypothetical protein
MKIFGLQPGAAPTDGTKRPGVAFAMIYGAVSFGLVSALAYSIWAFRLVPGQAAMYVSIAAVYIGLGGVALARLVHAPGAWKRFTGLFALGFLVYAVLWCAFWFGLKGKYLADYWGAAIGLAAMTAMLRSAFGATAGFLPLVAVLFVCHSLGYYLGDQLHAQVGRATGRLLWGVGHGLGFGAGLGYVLWHCQARKTETK